METQPRQGSLWKHKKTGGLYVVFPALTREADLEPLVGYQTVNPDARRTDIWVRPRAEFLEKFKPHKITLQQLDHIERRARTKGADDNG